MSQSITTIQDGVIHVKVDTIDELNAKLKALHHKWNNDPLSFTVHDDPNSVKALQARVDELEKRLVALGGSIE